MEKHLLTGEVIEVLIDYLIFIFLFYYHSSSKILINKIKPRESLMEYLCP